MKKLILALALLTATFAVGQSGYNQMSSPFYSCSAVTATGVCKYATLPLFGGYTIPSNFTWFTLTTGSPGSVSTTLEGSVDGRSTLDGVATASSTAFTSATMKFTPADVGKTIYIGGAGTAGVTFATTISAYVSATAVTLNNAAVTSIVGAPTFVGTFAVLDTSTATGGDVRSVVNYTMKYLRCNVGTLSGGSSPTLTCGFVVKGS